MTHRQTHTHTAIVDGAPASVSAPIRPSVTPTPPTTTDATVLDLCRAANAHVPTLCHDDRTTRGGHCRSECPLHWCYY